MSFQGIFPLDSAVHFIWADVKAYWNSNIVQKTNIFFHLKISIAIHLQVNPVAYSWKSQQTIKEQK